MTTLLEDLQSYQDKRKFPDWEPYASNANRKLDYSDGEQIVKSCLSFLDLEVSVGEWVKNATEIPPEAKSFLLRNSSDEEKHTVALIHLLRYYRGARVSRYSKELIKRWNEIDVHPIVKAYALECGVFFAVLPALTIYGDVYCATVSQWINDDERVHVETNLRVIRELKLKLTEELLELVFETVGYIFESLGEEKQIEQASRAVKRVVRGRDAQMAKDSVPITTAFFEQHDKRAIVY